MKESRKHIYGRLFLYDLKNSLKCNRILFIVTAVLFCLAAMRFRVLAQSYHHSQEVTGSVIDYLFYFLHGSAIPMEGKGQQFDIPITYTGLAMITSYITGNYMFRYNHYNSITKGQSRVAWLVSKLLCNTVSIAIVYLIVGVIGVVCGSKTLTFDQDMWQRLYQIEGCTLNQNIGRVFLAMFIVPMCTAIALSQLQVLLSLYLKNIGGFICVMVVYLAAIFSGSLWAIGNGCMVQKSEFFLAGGIPVMWILLMNLGVITAAAVVGIWSISKKDYLS